jgi:HlyD family secretion protein
MVPSPASGRVARVAVQVGTEVRQGDVVVELDHTEVDQRIASSEKRLDELQRQFRDNTLLARESDDMLAVANAQKVRLLDLQIDTSRAKVETLQERLVSQQKLFEQGLVVKSAVSGAFLDLEGARQEIESGLSQLRQIDADRIDRRKQRASELAALQIQIHDLEDTIRSLRLEQRNASQIVSPSAGRVIELRATVGAVVERGAALINIEQTGGARAMKAYLYLPLADGRKVRPEMAVEVNPTTSKREEFGFLRAAVDSVAEQPSTSQGLLLLYANDRIVQQLTTAYAPLQITARLRKAVAANPTGYEWSTRDGPPERIKSGTACTASVVLREVRPVELLMPQMRRYLGLAQEASQP